MLSRIYSFKFIIGFALLWLGALAYGLAIYSTQVYRAHAIQAQVDSLQKMLEHESREALALLYENQKQFALRLLNEAPFRKALQQRDAAAMRSWLGQSYTRYQVAAAGDILFLRISFHSCH